MKGLRFNTEIANTLLLIVILLLVIVNCVKQEQFNTKEIQEREKILAGLN